MDNILITGAGGFVGSKFFKFLKKKKLSVFGTVSKSKNKVSKIKEKIKDSRIIKCDLSRAQEVEKLIAKVKPNVIFHFAALANHNFGEANKKLCKKNNSQITKNLIKCIDKNVKFIFLSSDKVYASNPNQSPEHTNLNPLGYLAKEKILCEKMIKKKLNKYFILRLPIVHCNGKDEKNSTIDNFLYQLKKKKKICVFKNIKRSFLKIEEFNFFLEMLLLSNKYGIYNVGSRLFSYTNRIKELSQIYKINIKNKIFGKIGKIQPLAQDFSTTKIKKNFKINFT